MQNFSTTTCNYFNPRVWDGSLPTNKQDIFEYSSSTCVSIISEIKTASSTMTYGDILISFFLFLLILGSVFSFIIYHFLTKRPAK
jgi:hypothetical protein